MDSRRNNGSYPRSSSQYYDNDYQFVNQVPLTDKKQSFSARAGMEAPDLYVTQDPNYMSRHQDRYENGTAPPTSRQTTASLAALHAPQSNNMLPRLDTRLLSGQSPTSPLSPLEIHAQRKGSVPDKSPLQKLEGKLDDISKEEKRARMEEAEHRARQKAAANQSRRVDKQPQPDTARSRKSSSHAEQYVQSNNPTAERRDYPISQPNDRQHTHNSNRGSIDFGGEPFQPSVNRVNPAQTSQAIDAGHKFRRASDALRMQNRDRTTVEEGRQFKDPQPRISADAPSRGELERSESKKYRHRLRDAGYAGAAAAAAGGAAPGFGLDGIDRRDDHRKSTDHGVPGSMPDIGRSESWRSRDRISARQQQLQPDRTGTRQGLKSAITHQDVDPVSRDSVQIPDTQGSTHQVEPQIVGRQHSRARISFDARSQVSRPQEAPAGNRHRIGEFLHGHQDQPRFYQRGPVLDDWRNAGIAKLTLEDLMIDGTSTSRSNRPNDPRRDGPAAYDGPYDEEARSFQPPLMLKCGPLLRYTGLRRERAANPRSSGVSEREIWRGSVMIVTLDSRSSYGTPPTLRLFTQPMDLLPALPSNPNDELPLEYDDPLAGHVKLSRTGRPLFVKHVDLLEEGVDVSRIEDEDGLFEASKSPNLGSQHIKGSDGQQRRPITVQNRSRIRRSDGERAGKYREVRAARLHADRGVTFWRFNIEIELGHVQTRVAYRINRGPAIGFWVPARGESMNVMFHSCNGFSLSVDPNLFSGPDPLWRDVLNRHQFRPFHVMLGGGDQIYNDAAMRDTKLFREWLQTKNPEHKHKAEFTEEMQEELEDFYLERYSMWFSQGLFGLANCQIPMVNVWDDHDIIDVSQKSDPCSITLSNHSLQGYGSYPHHFMSTKVFTGLGAVAFKYYMLFQHQSIVPETQREEPSWLLGASPGPYINELSRSVFMFLGRKIAFLGLDCRTERMRDEVLSQESYDIVFDRCRTEIIKGETKHLIVLLGVPIAYPRLNFLENILTSRMMDPIKAIGRTGLLGGFVNKFDGGVEILDDLDDHWTAKHHKSERNWFIQELQELAAEKSVRVTILGGDVHLGAVGQFYTKKKLGVAKDRDHRYMPNIISSAIVNTPPPTLMGDVLNKRNKIHHLDAETDEDMIPMFERDVDDKPRNNLHLLPRRNYCTIREYVPGSTPQPSPRLEAQTPTSAWSQSQDNAAKARQYPPGTMKRTLSLTGGSFRPGNLVRRLSGSRMRTRRASVTVEPHESSQGQSGHVHNVHGRPSFGGNDPPSEYQGSYFPQTSAPGSRPTNTFSRRPTDLSEKRALKAAARGGPEGNVEGHEVGHIDLEGGLDISLNMEISQRDPAGTTRSYRLLVPALWYEGRGDANTARFKSRGASLMDHLRGKRSDRGLEGGHSGSEGDSRGSSLEDERVEGPTSGWPRSTSERKIEATSQPARRKIGDDGAADVQPQNNKEYGLLPSNRHPAHLATKEYKIAALPPAAPHPSQLPNAEKPRQEGRVSSGLFGFRRNPQSGVAYYDDSESDGSFTDSDIDSIEMEQQARQRRPSKAEQFFGTTNQRGGTDRLGEDRLDDTSGAQQPLGPNGLPYATKKRGWKLWK